MAKYKLISKKKLPDEFWEIGKIYDSEFRRNLSYFSVGEMAESNPDTWQLVEDDFVLPDQWCVKVGDPDKFEVFNEWRKTTPQGKYKGSYGYLCADGYFSASILCGWTLITFEQFKKYVLKENTMEKEIIGYKAPFDLFDGKIKKGDLYRTRRLPEGGYRPNSQKFDIDTSCNLPKEIVEQWKPVYKSTYPYITINGYKGEFFDNYAKFGCAEIESEVFIDLYNVGGTKHSNRQIESVTIGKGTFTKEQIKEIAEYYLNKK